MTYDIIFAERRNVFIHASAQNVVSVNPKIDTKEFYVQIK
jgi:hypothetical protein